MAYTVTKLARLSGVSVRTLHWYDEIGLLKPAYYGANGYRYYGEEELLMLQQILFFRELGIELKEIERIMKSGDFDKIHTLRSHRKFIVSRLEKSKQLIKTIDETIEHLTGIKKMKEHELFKGFSPEKQAAYEEELIRRGGEKAKKHIAESKEKRKTLDESAFKKECIAICEALTDLLNKHYPVDSEEVQEVIKRHFVWISQCWTPDKESYAGHGHLIRDSELRKAYELFHRDLPEYIAAAIQIFATRSL